MTHPSCIKHLIKDFAERTPMRATSMIVSVFGDVVSQHGGEIWLGSLVSALAPLGVDERLVRTSVFRLVKDGWLRSRKVGRKSYYSFSDYGEHEYERAAQRIYELQPRDWQGHWQLVIPRGLPEDVREPFRKSLYWQGFRQIATGVWARPSEDRRELMQTVDDFDAAAGVLVFHGMRDEDLPIAVAQDMVQEAWQVDDVAQRYIVFTKHYGPLHRWLQKNDPQPQSAFIARTLLLHDYRRILLKDTALPVELLPRDWPGKTSQSMMGEIYLRLASASVKYIRNNFEDTSGKVGNPGPGFNKRFRGKP